MIMNSFLNSVKLMARTGQFFAKCDGAYDQREERFVKAFTYSLGMLSDVKSTERLEVSSVLNTDSEFEELVSETLTLLNGKDEPERKRIIDSFDQFIRVTIEVDSKIRKNEARYYKEWRKRMGLPESHHEAVE